jgi:hypothetical protein
LLSPIVVSPFMPLLTLLHFADRDARDPGVIVIRL